MQAPFLVKALELAPNDIGSRLNLVRVGLALGRISDARKQAMTVLEKEPGNGEALLALVDTSRTPEEISAAEGELAKFPQKDSALLSSCNGGNCSKEIRSLRCRSCPAAGGSSRYHFSRGALRNGRRCIWRKRTTRKPEQSWSKRQNSPRCARQKRSSCAQFKVQNGAPEEAKTFLANVTKQAPDFLPAWPILARIANNEKKYDDALKLVGNSLSRDPANIDARLVQAESWIAKGETKKAVDSIEDLDRTYANSPVVKFALAQVYVRTNNLDQAIAAVDQVVNLSPRFVDGILLRAELHLKNGDAQSVVDSLSAVVKQFPGLSRAELMLAEAYRTLGRLDDATSIVREQIKRSPQNAGSYLLLGVILQQQNKVAEAREALEKAAQLAPNNPSSVQLLVDLDIASKNYSAGHRRVDEVLQKQPNFAVGYYLRGKLYLSEKKFDLAQAALLKAIDLNPNLSSAYDLLAPAFSQGNKPAEALNQINAVLAKKPDNLPSLAR